MQTEIVSFLTLLISILNNKTMNNLKEKSLNCSLVLRELRDTKLNARL